MSKTPTPIQLRVLERLMATVAAEAYMTVPQFKDIATSKKLKEEWAITPLKALEKLKMVERTPVKAGKASTWRITTLGVSAVMESRA
ncbi:hypothetical protein AB9K35_08045 [Leisingera sp. XS_AS12]|uniref:hypothetical protein n=1 Tax=Leisingera TaxID=191028 RepID=UPI000400D78C|nr:hypothetical protein [Leisingera caerulea]